MQTIILHSFVPTLNQKKFKDLEVTFNRTLDDDGRQKILIDEVFLEGANLTSSLSQTSLDDIQKAISRQLAIKLPV